MTEHQRISFARGERRAVYRQNPGGAHGHVAGALNVRCLPTSLRSCVERIMATPIAKILYRTPWPAVSQTVRVCSRIRRFQRAPYLRRLRAFLRSALRAYLPLRLQTAFSVATSSCHHHCFCVFHACTRGCRAGRFCISPRRRDIFTRAPVHTDVGLSTAASFHTVAPVFRHGHQDVATLPFLFAHVLPFLRRSARDIGCVVRCRYGERFMPAAATLSFARRAGAIAFLMVVPRHVCRVLFCIQTGMLFPSRRLRYALRRRLC